MSCYARYVLLTVVVLLGSMSILSACGKKGDLYLPEKPSQDQAK